MAKTNKPGFSHNNLAYIREKVMSTQPHAMKWHQQLLMWAEERRNWLKAAFIPGTLNIWLMLTAENSEILNDGP